MQLTTKFITKYHKNDKGEDNFTITIPEDFGFKAPVDVQITSRHRLDFPRILNSLFPPFSS